MASQVGFFKDNYDASKFHKNGLFAVFTDLYLTIKEEANKNELARKILKDKKKENVGQCRGLARIKRDNTVLAADRVLQI